MDTLELTLFDVESKSSQIWSKLRRNLRAHKLRLEMCGASQYKPNRPKSTARVFDRGGVFVKACPMYVDRAHTHATVGAVSAVAAAEQQPEGWRFVPDTILPGYQWAPQWVPARTPAVHWGPISGKAVGGPNTVQHSSTVQETPQTERLQAGPPLRLANLRHVQGFACRIEKQRRGRTVESCDRRQPPGKGVWVKKNPKTQTFCCGWSWGGNTSHRGRPGCQGPLTTSWRASLHPVHANCKNLKPEPRNPTLGRTERTTRTTQKLAQSVSFFAPLQFLLALYLRYPSHGQ